MNNIENLKKYEEEQEALYLRHMMHRYIQHYGQKCLSEEKDLPDSSLGKPSKAHIHALKKALSKQESSKSFSRVHPQKMIFRTAILVALLVITLVFSGAYKLNLFSFWTQTQEEYTEYACRDEDRAFLLK